MIASDPQAPLSDERNPVHQSGLEGLLVDKSKYRPADGGVFASTVRGSAFHRRQAEACNELVKPQPIAAYFADELARQPKVDWEGRTQAEMVREAEQWCAALDPIFSPRASHGFLAEYSFKFRLPENGCWYEGTIDVMHIEFADGRLRHVSLYDYKTGAEQPDFKASPQHHLYCLGLKYGVIDSVPYLPGHHILDWTRSSEASAFFPRKWPKAFRYQHLPPLVNRNAAWSLLALGTDSQPMTVENSTRYICELTKRLLDQQPTRLAVSVSAPAEPQPTIENMQPQNTTIVPAQNHKVALEVSENIDLFRLGDVFSKSGFFVDCKDANQAVVKILAGRELGLPPFQSLSGIHVVKGKATMGATLIAARIKGSGKYDYVVIEMGEKRCSIEFFEIRSGQRISIGKSEFTESDATKAGTQNMGKFPRNMLFARAISNGAKWFTPDIFGGPIYVPEEMEPEEPAEPIKSVAVEVAAPTPAPIQPQPLYTFGEPRGAGYATDAQLKRIRANCDALGFNARKVLVTAVALGAAKEIVSVADVSEKVATQLVMKLDGLLKHLDTPRPDREKTAAEILDEQIHQIIGDEIRTKNAKALRELMTSGSLTPDDVLCTMEAEVGADRQFNSLVEQVQNGLLATLTQQASAKADRQLVATGAANGNGNGKH